MKPVLVILLFSITTFVFSQDPTVTSWAIMVNSVASNSVSPGSYDNINNLPQNFDYVIGQSYTININLALSSLSRQGATLYLRTASSTSSATYNDIKLGYLNSGATTAITDYSTNWNGQITNFATAPGISFIGYLYLFQWRR